MASIEQLTSELYYYAGLCASRNALEAKRGSWFALMSMGGPDMAAYLNAITDAVRDARLNGESPFAAAQTVVTATLEDVSRWAKPLF